MRQDCKRLRESMPKSASQHNSAINEEVGDEVCFAPHITSDRRLPYPLPPMITTATNPEQQERYCCQEWAVEQ